ncbi:hypothetical protein, partial [Nocardioides humilatus]|uniref:hypothetical protein n=1 Tax=Nocardioides humilatus TaxID=2607660 RepID=UPI001CB6D0A6
MTNVRRVGVAISRASDAIVVERLVGDFMGFVSGRVWVVSALTGLILSVGVVATPPVAVAAAEGTLTSSAAAGIAGESVTLTGSLPPQASRPV